MNRNLVLFISGAVVAVCARPSDAAAQLAPAASASSEKTDSQPLPRFNGYMGTSAEKLFALSVSTSDGALVNQAWVKIGQKIGGFELVAFDGKTEMLKLKTPAGNSVELALVDSKVMDAGKLPQLSRDDARAYALDAVAAYLKTVREAHPDWNVVVNPDLATMPEDKRQDFLKRQEAFKARTGGQQFLIPFRSADGRWGTALSTSLVRGSSLLPPAVFDSLTEEDRREISLAYSIARAEEVARSVPPKEKP